MKKRILTACLVGVMLSISAIPTMAADIDISIDGLTQAGDYEVINSEGYNLLGLRDVFEMLGAEVSWNPDKRLVKATKGDTYVELYVSTNEATVNGEKVELPTGCVIKDDSVYVPIRFVSDAFGCKIDWDEEKRTVSITANDNSYVLLKTSQEITEATNVLSYEDALALAVKKSTDLKNLDDSVDYLKDLRSDLGDSIWSLDHQQAIYNNAIFDENSTADEVISAQLAMQSNVESVISVARSIKSVEQQQAMFDVNKQMIEDGIQLTLRNYISAIKSAEMQMGLLEQSIELGKVNIEQLELKNELGYTSDYDLQTAKNTQKTNETNLENLKLDLEKKKQNLKTFLGLPAEEDLYVDYEVEFNTLEDVKLESYITKQREADLSIKTLKSSVFLAEYTVRTNQAYDSEMTIKVQNDLKTAQRQLSDGKDTVEKNIRNGYNTLKQLEESNKSLKLAVEQAKADYNKVVAAYAAGNATALNVEQAKLAITSAEQAVEENAINYDMYSFAFEHPYLLASMG